MPMPGEEDCVLEGLPKIDDVVDVVGMLGVLVELVLSPGNCAPAIRTPHAATAQKAAMNEIVFMISR